jgi:hypothetical protein
MYPSQRSGSRFSTCRIADYLIRQRTKLSNAKESSYRKPAGRPATQQNKILRYVIVFLSMVTKVWRAVCAYSVSRDHRRRGHAVVLS